MFLKSEDGRLTGFINQKETLDDFIIEKNDYLFTTLTPRKSDNSVDWITWLKNLKLPQPLKSREGREVIEKFIKEKMNFYLMGHAKKLAKLNSLAEFNHWFNEYADLIAGAEKLLWIEQECSKAMNKIPPSFYKDLIRTTEINKPEIGHFYFPIRIFDNSDAATFFNSKDYHTYRKLLNDYFENL